MPCLAEEEEVLKAPVGQPAFQQLKGAAALYCQSPSLEESGRERLITPAFLPRNTGIATIVADGSTAGAVTLLRLLVH